MDTLDTNGIRIAYERVGRGPALILAHGAAEDHRVWRPQVEALADELTVVAWDEPGAGGSSDVPAGFTLGDYADCLGGMIEALGLAPVHLGGLSWGGTVALETYRRHPSLVGTLILIDTYAGWKGSLPAVEVQARVEGAQRMLTGSPGGFDPTFPGLFAADPPPEYASLLAELAADVRPESLRRQLTVMADADLSEMLPQISVPTLLVWGELDVRSPLSIGRRFEREIPGAELVVIPGAGHLSTLEQPVPVNRALRRFCSGHPQGHDHA